MEKEPEKILTIFDEKERIVIQIGLMTTFYFDNGHLPEVRKSLAECFDEYLTMFGDNIRWIVHPEIFRLHESGEKKVPSPGEWFQADKLGPDDPWSFTYHGGRQPDEASDFRISALGNRKWLSEIHGSLSHIHFSLPLKWFFENSVSFVELVLNWCNKLNPVHGYAGIGILESYDLWLAQRYEQQVYALAKRFPGLEVDYPVIHAIYLRNGIKGANWLTILGNDWLSKLGGRSILEKNLGEPFKLHDYSTDIIIQAGPYPELGDVNRRLDAVRYRKVAQILKPIRIKEHKAFHALAGFGQEETNAWLARFDSDDYILHANDIQE